MGSGHGGGTMLNFVFVSLSTQSLPSEITALLAQSPCPSSHL